MGFLMFLERLLKVVYIIKNVNFADFSVLLADFQNFVFQKFKMLLEKLFDIWSRELPKKIGPDLFNWFDVYRIETQI